MMTEAEKELSRKLLNTQAEVLALRDDMALMNGLILSLRGELDRLRQAVKLPFCSPFDCEKAGGHSWDGSLLNFRIGGATGGSATCSRCGISAIDYDITKR